MEGDPCVFSLSAEKPHLDCSLEGEALAAAGYSGRPRPA